MVAGINRVPTGGADSASARVQIANSLNATIAQLATAQTNIATLQGQVSPIGGDLTGTMPNPTVAANKIDNTKLAQMATKTIKGNAGAGTANAADLTAAQVKALLGGTLAQAPVITETGLVATGTGTFTSNNTVPTNTNGDQYLTATITPTSASSTLIIEVDVNVSASASVQMALMLFQDTTASAIAAALASTSGASAPIKMTLRHKMAAGTTSATTFKVRIGSNVAATTVTFNGNAGSQVFGGVMASSIKITEILP